MPCSTRIRYYRSQQKVGSKPSFLLEDLFPIALTSSVFMIFTKCLMTFPAMWGRKLLSIPAFHLCYTFRLSADFYSDSSRARTQDFIGLLEVQSVKFYFFNYFGDAVIN